MTVLEDILGMDISEPLNRLRDYFVITKEYGKAEVINEILNALDDRPKVFFLTIEESRALADYFLKRAGYISNEFDEPVLCIIRKLDEFLKD